MSLCDKELVASFAGLDTPGVSDAMDKLGLPGQAFGITPLANYDQVVVGPAFTVQYVSASTPPGTVGDLDVFRRELTEGRSFYSDQASQLVVGADDKGTLAQLTRLGRQESANIASTIEQVDPATFEAVVASLSQAKRVRIHGMRQFNSLALFMAYGLGMLRPDVGALDSSRQGVADALAQLETGDVLVVPSCFPYTPSVLATAEVAARHGITVIALTDSASSPLAKTTRHSFFVPNRSLFFSNSMCVFMLLAEGLLSAVASSLGEASVEALKYRETLIAELNASL